MHVLYKQYFLVALLLALTNIAISSPTPGNQDSVANQGREHFIRDDYNAADAIAQWDAFMKGPSGTDAPPQAAAATPPPQAAAPNVQPADQQGPIDA